MCDDATQNVLPLSRRRQGVSVLSALCGWLTPAIVESPLARSLSHAADELASYNASCRQPHRHRAAKALKKRAPFAKCFHFSGENRHILPSFSGYVGGSSLQTSSSGVYKPDVLLWSKTDGPTPLFTAGTRAELYERRYRP